MIKIVRSKILIGMLAVMLVLSGCGKKDEASEQASASNEKVDRIDMESEYVPPAEPEVVEEEEEPEEEIPEGMYRSELTNEPISEDLKDQRPIAAMIDNEKTALNHFGTNSADIIYEMMNSTANDRVTRLMAIFKDYESVEQIGSIRSVRPTNFMVAAEYNAIICHDGGPFYIDEYIARPYTSHFSGTFSRVKNGKAREFTEYILPGDMEKNFNNSKVSKEYNEYYPGPHFTFNNNFKACSEQGATEEAKEVSLPFYHNSSQLKFNEANNTYDYYEYGSAHVDEGAGNETTTFTNVILMSCSFHQYDPNGYMVYNIVGNGEGYYLTGGEAIKIKWSKSEEAALTEYTIAETGESLVLNTGKTYIGIVPDDTWSEVTLN